MLITPANLSFFFTNVETRFWQAYSTAPTFIDKIATTYPVTSEKWVSGWMGMLDKMRMWKGSRVTRSPAPQTYMVEIQPFELTESIDQFRLEDDTYGIYFPMIAMMGENIKKWPDYALRDLLQNTGDYTGLAQKGIDGLNHWSTVHPVDPYDDSKGTYSNDFRGGMSVDGITVGGTLGVNSFATLWSEIASRKSENGESLGLLPGLTLAPTQLKLTLDTILQAQFFAPPTLGNLASNVGSTENVMKGWTDRLIWPDLSADPTTWMMLVNDKPVKPFSWLQRQAPNFVYRINPQDPVVFDTHTYLYGSMSRGAPAWGFPWLSAISGPTP
jgi:phage major head subunit gpT-like protein